MKLIRRNISRNIESTTKRARLPACWLRRKRSRVVEADYWTLAAVGASYFKRPRAWDGVSPASSLLLLSPGLPKATRELRFVGSRSSSADLRMDILIASCSQRCWNIYIIRTRLSRRYPESSGAVAHCLWTFRTRELCTSEWEICIKNCAAAIGL